MLNINVFINNGSDNETIFYGKSISGKVGDGSIIKIDTDNVDDLISEALKVSEDDTYIICAFGPLKTTNTVSSIYDTIEKVIEAKKFDIMYLTSYGNRCNMTDIYTYNNLDIVTTFSPHGVECILISPSGIRMLKPLVEKINNSIDGRKWDYYLNANGENMVAVTTFPPLIMVDVSKRKDNSELIKTTVCREEINIKNPVDLSKRYTGNMNIFWFFIIIVFILLLAIMLLNLGGVKLKFNGEQNYDGKLGDVPLGMMDPTGQLVE